jgi:hypothetical protein
MDVSRRRRLWIAGVGVAVAVAAVIVRLLPDTAPDSDFAVIDLAVFRVLHGWQAVGPYSRFGWNHPGPIYFQLLAPLYALGGLRHLSVVLTVAAMNAASLIGLAAILRRNSPAMLWAAVVWLVVYLVRLDGLLASPWNPYVPLLPLALLLASAAAAASGAYRLLPLVVGLASFVIQTHVGFAAVAVAAVAATGAIIGVDWLGAARRGLRLDRSLVRGLAAAAALGVLLWAVPLIDEVRPGGLHNLRQLATYLTETAPHNPRLSAQAFEHLIVAPFTPHLQLWSNTPLPGRELEVRRIVQIQAAALVAATIVFFRRRQRFERNLAVIVMLTSLAGLAAVRRLPEAPLEYTLLWVTILGVMAWTIASAVPIAALLEWITRRSGGRPLLSWRWLTATLIVMVVAACLHDVVALRAADVRNSTYIERLTALVRTKLDRLGAREPFIRVPQAFWGVATGVVLQLRLAGLSPHVDADWVSMFGPDCAPTGREPVTIVFAKQPVDAVDSRASGERLGQVDDIIVYAVTPAGR